MSWIINPIYSILLLLFLVPIQAQSRALPGDTIPPNNTKFTEYNYIPWEAGVIISGANAYSDLVDAPLSKPSETNLSYGAFVRYKLAPSFALRANVIRGTLTGSDLTSKTLDDRGFQFESPLTEFSLMGEVDFMGRNNSSGGLNSKVQISPYAFFGVGYTLTDPDVDFSNAADNPALQARIQEDLDNVKTSHVSVPVGVGVKGTINMKWVVGIEFGLRPVFNDYLDGVSAAGNATRNDWYSIGAIHVGYCFGANKSKVKEIPEREYGFNLDSDQDGILDEDDRCPRLKGSADTEGCPDKDMDGVADIDDLCPNEIGSREANGCPDEDKDGVADSEDLCPGEVGSKAAMGCPDADHDGVVDAEDKCPYIPGSPETNGCRDTDKDGVIDTEDQCPYEKGDADNNGCPSPNPDRDGDGFLNAEDECPDKAGTLNGCPDTDGDGVADHHDNCPEKAGEYNGCPDTDGDGFADDVDRCPELAGSVAKNGCPELSPEDIAILDDAINNVRFNTGSYKLTSTSRPLLDDVASLMKRYPTYHLAIEGYTDNQGDPEANKRLSENRAKACYNYLHEQGGIEKERMSFTGFGQEKPRATNDTKSGRRLNRRVEFKIDDGE
jgi:OOP family OmpA-OmpF porin